MREHVTALFLLSTQCIVNSFSLNQNVEINSYNRKQFLHKVATAFQATTTFSLLQTLNPQQSHAYDEAKIGGKIVYGGEDIMSPKNHGTTDAPVQENLRYGVSRKIADRICCYNRHFAEYGGYFEGTSFRNEMLKAKGAVTFYDRWVVCLNCERMSKLLIYF